MRIELLLAHLVVVSSAPVSKSNDAPRNTYSHPRAVAEISFVTGEIGSRAVQDAMPLVNRLQKKVLASMSGAGIPILEFGTDLQRMLSVFEASLEKHARDALNLASETSSLEESSEAAVASAISEARDLALQQLVVGIEPSMRRHLDLQVRQCVRLFEDDFASVLAYDDGLGASGSLGEFNQRASQLKR